MGWFRKMGLRAVSLALDIWGRLRLWRVPADVVAPTMLNTPKAIAAVHEAGHLIAAWCCTGVCSIDSVTVRADDTGTVAFWFWRPAKEKLARATAWCDVVIALSGIAAEAMVFRKFRTGKARSDLAQAIASARLVDGNTCPALEGPSVPFDKIYAAGCSPDELAVLQAGYRMARKVLVAHGDIFYKVVNAILTMGYISEEQMATILGRRDFVKIVGRLGAKPTFIVPKAA